LLLAPYYTIDDPGFINKLFEILPSLNSHLLIFGGDLNCVIDPVLDRSSSRTITPTSMSKSIVEFMSKNGCVDPWRFCNPQNKEFSFFSQAHQSYSRIDYFFIDSSLISKVKSVSYHAIVISDHAPLNVDIQFSVQPRYSSLWRLNTLLLSDEKFIDFISNSIDNFLATNQDGVVTYSLLWETLKAYLRGQIISYSAHSRRVRNMRIRELTSNICQIDQLLANSPSQDKFKQHLDLQAELDLVLTEEAERLLLHSRSTYYEHGDKAGRLLAHKLRRQAASRLIPQIQDLSGNLISEPEGINATFKSFYYLLYTSESPSDAHDMTCLFTELKFHHD